MPDFETRPLDGSRPGSPSWESLKTPSASRTRRQNNSLGVRYASLKHVLAVSPETALVRPVVRLNFPNVGFA